MQWTASQCHVELEMKGQSDLPKNEENTSKLTMKFHTLIKIK